MIDVTSALMGGGGIATGFGVFYAIYSYGRHRATKPSHIVNMEEIGNYRRQTLSLEALDNHTDNNTNDR